MLTIKQILEIARQNGADIIDVDDKAMAGVGYCDEDGTPVKLDLSSFYMNSAEEKMSYFYGSDYDFCCIAA